MYNTITSAGYLVTDPEVRNFKDNKVCHIRVCISSDRSKEKCFIDAELWGKQAEVANEYLKKGRSILFTGELKYSSWEHEGKKYSKNFIRVNEFTFLPSSQKSEDGSQEKETVSVGGSDEDIPF
ncbi:MAG: single-stranded DNA-binding protein [Candidatus Lokiarchaeota archaeon]|nr:single-stranded DNA-binding protein [Candidatus Lokiarchaeota archaeon]